MLTLFPQENRRGCQIGTHMMGIGLRILCYYKLFINYSLTNPIMLIIMEILHIFVFIWSIKYSWSCDGHRIINTVSNFGTIRRCTSYTWWGSSTCEWLCNVKLIKIKSKSKCHVSWLVVRFLITVKLSKLFESFLYLSKTTFGFILHKTWALRCLWLIYFVLNFHTLILV